MKNFPTPIKVNKADYEVYSFMSGFFGICEKSHNGGNCVQGGDSANEDDYNEEYMNEVFENWGGTLYYSDAYGYLIAE